MHSSFNYHFGGRAERNRRQRLFSFGQFDDLNNRVLVRKRKDYPMSNAREVWQKFPIQKVTMRHCMRYPKVQTQNQWAT